MLKKRLVGIVTVRQGWAVQSFGYKRYLPLGRPEVLVENLDRWGADEILLQCIDRTTTDQGPDFALLKRIADIGLSTPLIYSGGIRNHMDGVDVVRLGADRVAVDTLLWAGSPEIERLARELGTQAIIGHMPVQSDGSVLLWRDYRGGHARRLDSLEALNACMPWLSEIMLTDWSHEGTAIAFDESIPNLFPNDATPLILFGGLSEPTQMKRLLQRSNVVAVVVGNFLSYREHAIQHLKREFTGVAIRPPEFAGLESVR
jgi:cyclase